MNAISKTPTCELTRALHTLVYNIGPYIRLGASTPNTYKLPCISLFWKYTEVTKEEGSHLLTTRYDS